MPLTDELLGLASQAGQTVVSSATSDTWGTVKGRFARVLGGDDLERVQLAETRLEQTRVQLVGQREPELQQVQARLKDVWQTRLTDLLEEHPDRAEGLRAVIDQVSAELRGVTVSAPLQILSPLLTAYSAIDQATQARLVHAIGGRQAILVELDVPTSASAAAAREQFLAIFHTVFNEEREQPPEPLPISANYMRCFLTSDETSAMLDMDSLGNSPPGDGIILRIWPDYRLRAHIDHSVTTIKADAAARTYSASGEGIVWAVIDSGIDKDHPHFAGGTLTDPAVSHLHRDFTGLLYADGIVTDDPAPALTDRFGHGTHVAGIIAGAAPADPGRILIGAQGRSSGGLPWWVTRALEQGRTLNGMAPKARLVSLKVLDSSGYAVSSAVIAALAQIRAFNADSRQLLIHGVNLSLGCEWYPDEFAAGQSPLCRELDQLVSTGVVAVVSAGNEGAGGTLTGGSSEVQGRLSTIADPGNAIRAITVGSTHRRQPHVYGVTYTSSKGPTLDGRLKPDLVAPGERITSAATGELISGIHPLQSDVPDVACYVEYSGTSTAAAHVSGAIAALLSVRGEYVGQPDEVKRLFMSNASSLGRHEFFQGAGLVDLVRALSNVESRTLGPVHAAISVPRQADAAPAWLAIAITTG